MKYLKRFNESNNEVKNLVKLILSDQLDLVSEIIKNYNIDDVTKEVILNLNVDKPSDKLIKEKLNWATNNPKKPRETWPPVNSSLILDKILFDDYEFNFFIDIRRSRGLIIDYSSGVVYDLKKEVPGIMPQDEGKIIFSSTNLEYNLNDPNIFENLKKGIHKKVEDFNKFLNKDIYDDLSYTIESKII